MHASLSPVRRAANHFRERQPELGAEHGVYDRVEGGVEVAEPQEEAGHVLVDDAARAQGHDQGHDEERQPAHDERAGDDGQCLGGLPLALRLQRFLLLALRLDARRRHRSRRRHGHPVVHVHLDHRVPAGRRSVRDRRPVVLDHRHRRLQLIIVVLMRLVVRRRGPVVVVRCDRERGGLVVVLCTAAATAAAAAAAPTAVSHFGLTPAAAAATVLRRFRHGTARMTVDQSNARAYGRLFYFFLFLDPQEHGLSEEAAFLGFGLGSCIVRRLFQPVTHANKSAVVAFSHHLHHFRYI